MLPEVNSGEIVVNREMVGVWMVLQYFCETTFGGRGGIRTRDPWLRRPVLYPAELPAHTRELSEKGWHNLPGRFLFFKGCLAKTGLSFQVGRLDMDICRDLGAEIGFTW